MNNFYLGQDPLLYREPVPQYNVPMPDRVGDLEKRIESLEEGVKNELIGNKEYMSLKEELDRLVQGEILMMIRGRLNSNPRVQDNINKQLEILGKCESQWREKQRAELLELNDYIKNYSDLTFKEYKELKNENR